MIESAATTIVLQVDLIVQVEAVDIVVHGVKEMEPRPRCAPAASPSSA